MGTVEYNCQDPASPKEQRVVQDTPVNGSLAQPVRQDCPQSVLQPSKEDRQSLLRIKYPEELKGHSACGRQTTE